MSPGRIQEDQYDFIIWYASTALDYGTQNTLTTFLTAVGGRQVV